MAIIVPPDGDQPCELLLVGERPGQEEWDAASRGLSRCNFIGPAGRELWSRVERVLGLQRSDFRVVNLVPTFGLKPPTDAEVAEHRWRLDLELRRTKPTFILTIGYHAARALVPAIRGLRGDYFHGLPYSIAYGRLAPRRAIVVPIVHAAAALRQPDRYQNQLTADLEAAKAIIEGVPWAVGHAAKVVAPFEVGLAKFGRTALTLGLDTEGSTRAPECISLSNLTDEGCCVEVASKGWPQARKWVADSLRVARDVYIHNALHDIQALHSLRLDELPLPHDSMVMAYLLGQPQSLKVLGYRLLQRRMRDYEDVIGGLDEKWVREAIRRAYQGLADRIDEARRVIGSEHERRARRAARDLPRLKNGKRRKPKKAAPVSAAEVEAAIGVAPRALTSLKKFAGIDGDEAPEAADQEETGADEGDGAVGGDADSAVESGDAEGEGAKETLRKRWSKSVFAPLVVLPPPPTWKDAPTKERRSYAIADAAAHLDVGTQLLAQVQEQGLGQVYQIDRDVLPFLARNEEIGLACDTDKLAQVAEGLRQEFNEKLEALKQSVRWADFNPLSPPQVSHLLYQRLGLPAPRKRGKGGLPSTEDKYLKALRHLHPAVNQEIELRQIDKMRGTYAERVPTLVRDGRYFPHWRHTRTTSGRLAEEVITLIPKHTLRGLLIRTAFHATDGHALVLVDLSQIEMRVMAHLSKDRRLLDAYRRGIDIHAQTAHLMLGAPARKEDQDESRHRLPAKTFNFAIINGTTEYGLYDQLQEQGQRDWIIDELTPALKAQGFRSTREFLREWFKVYPGVATFWEGEKAKARGRGYVEDMFGRRRYLAGVHSTNDRIVREAERQSLHAIQSSADGISKLWNKAIWDRVLLPRYQEGRRRRWRYCEPWVRVHDETVLEVDDRISKTIRQEMIACLPQPLSIPVTAEGVIESAWGERKLAKLQKASAA